jgi:hypothetical protein
MNSDPGRVIVFTLAGKAAPSTRKRVRQGRLPRVTRLMALALRFEDLLCQGTVKDYADLARLGHVTRARISQIMTLLNLAPDIQEQLLFLEPVWTWRDEFRERGLRAVVRESNWKRQRRLFSALQNSAQ